MSKRIQLRQAPWYGDTEFEIDFPDSWDVHVCQMRGADAPALTAEARDRKYRKEVLLPSEVEGTMESSYRDGILEIKLRKRNRDSGKIIDGGEL